MTTYPEIAGKKKARPSNPWWNATKRGEAYQSITSISPWLTRGQSSRNEEFLAYARLYTGRDILSFETQKYSVTRNRLNKFTYPIVQSVVDTVCSHVSKTKVRPYFLTQEGNSFKRKKAQTLQKVIDGLFYETGFYRKAPIVFRDACIFGNGYLKFFEHNGRVKIQRTHPANIFVDDYEAKNGDPRTMYEKAEIDREALLKIYEKDGDACKVIEAAASVKRASNETDGLDLIEVWEGWRLPSFKKANNGKHVISLETGDLLVEPWKLDRFPFSIMRWSEPINGFYGQGLAEILMYVQLEINYVMKRMQRAIHRMATPLVFIERGSKVDKNMITNEVGSFVPYTGQIPQSVIFQAISPEVFKYLQWLIDSAYQQIGINTMSAQGKLPAGLESGKAIRSYSEEGDERQIMIGQRWEDFALDAAANAISMVQMIYEDKKEFMVMAKGDKDIETLDWGDVYIDETDYAMQTYPTSLLSTTPSARLDDVVKLSASNMYSPNEVRKLLNFPDTEAVDSLLDAPDKLLDKILDKIVFKGKYTPADPFMDLDAAFKKANNQYLLAKEEDVPQDRLEMLRNFMTSCKSLIDIRDKAKNDALAAAQAPQPALPGLPPQQPEGAPMGAPPQGMMPL